MRRLGLACLLGIALSFVPLPAHAKLPNYEATVHAARQKVTDFLWIIWWAIDPTSATREEYGNINMPGGAGGNGNGSTKQKKCQDCQKMQQTCAQMAAARALGCIHNIAAFGAAGICNDSSPLLPDGSAGQGPKKVRTCEWDEDRHKPDCHIDVQPSQGCIAAWAGGIPGKTVTSTKTSGGQYQGGFTAGPQDLKVTAGGNFTWGDTNGSSFAFSAVGGFNGMCNTQMVSDMNQCNMNIDCTPVCQQ
jgi:hypothetical protein